jgi:hypothetical protein
MFSAILFVKINSIKIFVFFNTGTYTFFVFKNMGLDFI